MKRILGAAASALLVLVLAFLLFAPSVAAADPKLPHNGRVIISTEGDVNVPAGEHYDAVVVVKGAATVAGEVNTIIVVDGTVNLTAARTESVVAVRSPVTLGPGSVVLADVLKLDSVVTRQGNAEVQGEIRDIALDVAGLGFFLGSAMLLLYVGFAIAAIVAGLLVAAIAARQVRAAEELIRREPVQVFVTGFFGMFVPLIVAIALFVTIVGAPLGIGILLGLWPLAAFVGYLVTGIFIGDWVLSRTSTMAQRERPYLAAVIGLIVLQLLGILPFLAGIATLFGYGAVILLAWRTLRGPGGAIVGSQPLPQPAAG
jgi:hypothetical protein